MCFSTNIVEREILLFQDGWGKTLLHRTQKMSSVFDVLNRTLTKPT